MVLGRTNGVKREPSILEVINISQEQENNYTRADKMFI